ncbi:MAG: YrbL family protein [Pseudomonadota bacterium]
MLHLNPDDQVATGVQRGVFLHPHDPTKLVKVLKDASAMPKRTNFNGVMDRLMPSTRLRQIRKEYQEYLRIMLQHHDRELHLPISHMYGFAPTNLGLGCLTERVMEPDGTLGQTVNAKVKSGTLTDNDLALLNDAISRIYGYHIRASDMNAKNFVIGHRHDGAALGPRECVLVDGFGDIHAIPVRSLSQWTNRLGLDDSCARLARKSKLKWNAATRQLQR